MKIFPLVLAIFAVCCICSSAAATMIYFSWDDVSEFLGLSKSPAPAAVLAPTYQIVVAPNEPLATPPNNPPLSNETPDPSPKNEPSSVPQRGKYCRGGYCLDVARFSEAYNAERATKSGLPPCEWSERVADNCWCISKYCGRCDNDPYAALPHACGVGTHCGDWAWGRVCHVTNEPGGFASAPVPSTDDITDVAIDAMRRLGDAASHRGTVHSTTASTMGMGFTKCGSDKMMIVLTGAGAGGEFGPGGYKHAVRPCP